MSIITPIFNIPIETDKPEWSSPPSPSSSTSSGAASPSRQPAAAYVGALSQLHQSLVVLPTVLCGPSRPSSPVFQDRMKKLQTRIQHSAVNTQSTVDLKRLWSSRINCKGARAVLSTDTDVIPGDGEVPNVLPDTEEEWYAWEALVKERRARKHTVPPEKIQIARDKVDSWRAAVPTDVDLPRVSTTQESDRSSKLNFRVVKRAPTLKAKSSAIKGPSQVSGPQKAESQPSTASDSQRKSGDQEVVPAEIVPDSQVEVEESQTSKKVIDLPDDSDFPAPSFPAQLIASTPKCATITTDVDVLNGTSGHTLSPIGEVTAAAAVTKPAVQDSHVVMTSYSDNAPSPGSRKSVVSDPLDDHTSDYPHLRKVSNTPELPGGGIQYPSRPVTPTNTTLAKAENATLHSPSSRNSPKRVRTASPDRLVPKTPPPPLDAHPSLGNADCLPLPTTPGKGLPEIPELLATSRSSRVRPRPPSRKKGKDADGENRKTPSVYMTDEDAEEAFSDVSPSKSYFSSPASGSSDSSPGATRHIPSSPISPSGARFIPNPRKFAPMAASTQVIHDNLSDDDQQEDAKQRRTKGLERASSGLLGMAYCSQFDVNAHMDQLNEFIDRDVDFDAWIKDIEPEDEEEVASQL